VCVGAHLQHILQQLDCCDWQHRQRCLVALPLQIFSTTWFLLIVCCCWYGLTLQVNWEAVIFVAMLLASIAVVILLPLLIPEDKAATEGVCDRGMVSWAATRAGCRVVQWQCQWD
jgi:hypothetical protein